MYASRLLSEPPRGFAPRPGMKVLVAGALGRRWPERVAGDATGRQVAGSGPGRPTAAGADPGGDGAGGPGVGTGPFLLPSRGGDRPGPPCRCVGETLQGGDSPATWRGLVSTLYGGGGLRGGPRGRPSGRARTLTLPFPAPFCVSPQTLRPPGEPGPPPRPGVVPSHPPGLGKAEEAAAGAGLGGLR